MSLLLRLDLILRRQTLREFDSNEQIERAEKALHSDTKIDRSRQSNYKRFITKTSVTDSGEIADKKVYTLDKEKIAAEEQYDGFYCVATNLEDSVIDIIKGNHRRWEIEESFRIMKTEFSARPAYLSRDDRIIAHFTTCFLALVLFRYFEKGTGHKYTCTQLLDALKSIKFIKTQEGFIPAYVRTDITDVLHTVFGARTDYQITTFGDMKKIFPIQKNFSLTTITEYYKEPTNSFIKRLVDSLTLKKCQTREIICYDSMIDYTKNGAMYCLHYTKSSQYLKCNYIHLVK